MAQGPPERERALVIAHRGASGYLPEHTLAAKALAFGMRADYLEQDLVLSRDGVPVVLHDIHLDTVTNVAQKFPKRIRPDGRYYAIDFDLSELRQLTVHERRDRRTGKPVYPKRFPTQQGHFTIPTLAEELELIRGLNQSTGRQVGIYPEIKQPAWHREQGREISQIVLRVLDEYGYRGPEDRCYLQCFEADENRRIRQQLGSRLLLIQLVGGKIDDPKSDAARMLTPQGLESIAQYANGIGPSIDQLRQAAGSDGLPRGQSIVEQAHRVGLQVHPYTVRADDLPAGVDSLKALVQELDQELRVDGMFTDFPDQVLAALEQETTRASKSSGDHQ